MRDERGGWSFAFLKGRGQDGKADGERPMDGQTPPVLPAEPATAGTDMHRLDRTTECDDHEKRRKKKTQFLLLVST